jgi:hypothetical protein
MEKSGTPTLLTAPLTSAKTGGAKWFRFYKQIIYEQQQMFQ